MPASVSKMEAKIRATATDRQSFSNGGYWQCTNPPHLGFSFILSACGRHCRSRQQKEDTHRDRCSSLCTACPLSLHHISLADLCIDLRHQRSDCVFHTNVRIERAGSRWGP